MGLKIKGEHTVSIFIIINQNIPPQIFNFSYLNFKNFHPHMYKIMYSTKIVCSINKKKNKTKKKKKKKGGGNIKVFLHTLFVE